MMKTFFILLCMLACLPALAQTTDIMPDTWVGIDGLGRQLPTSMSAPLKTDRPRTVGIFYITWHDEGKYHLTAPYAGDVSKVLQADSTARRNGGSKAWKEASYHWGEPELGYFLSRDEYVIRKDMSMLADAGVDVIILDVTNAVLYWEEWKVLFATMEKMRSEGNRVPKFCFWAFNGDVVSVVTQLYERVYKEERYKDLWFYWDGRPLLLYNANPSVDANGAGYKRAAYPSYIYQFFTLRNMWWGYYEWAGKPYVGKEDHWCFGYELGDRRVSSLQPSQLASMHEGRAEEMAVTPAQHPISIVGKSWTRSMGEPSLDHYDLPDSAFVPWLGRRVAHPERYGLYFQERWNEALAVDPDFIYLNDWNEWTAGKYVAGKAPGSDAPGPTTFLGRQNDFYFVDQYNAEFNRTIQPQRGGAEDNYYMQMAENIRRYKGVRPIPRVTDRQKIRIDGRFDDWKRVESRFLDTRADVAHRNHHGYGGLHYVNTSGRNDIVCSKVSITKRHVYFYVECDSAITSYRDPRWMLLLIDADHDPATGWEGFDYAINYHVVDSATTCLMAYRHQQWQKVGLLPYRCVGNEMEIAIPRDALRLPKGAVTFDFKWADNPQKMERIIDLCTDGDTAPNRRFRYRVIQ